MIITKIRIHDTEVLREEPNLKVKRKSLIGNAILPLFIAGSLVVVGAMNSSLLSPKEDIVSYPLRDFNFDQPAIVMPVDIEEVNNLNLVLNDNDCGDVFFQNVVDQLQEDGFSVAVAKGGDIVNQDNATIVTLDQQYNAGDDAVIFAPYDNTRVGHSDSLALSMQTAFQQNGVQVGPILCGQVGYQEDQDGNVRYVVPTPTESQIDEGCDSSFITISLGTQNQDPEQIAKSIEDGLARQNIYLKSFDNQTDLIYRSNSGDSLEGIADYFGTDTNRLRTFNSIGADGVKDSQTIINPYVEEMRAFDANKGIQLVGENAKVH